MPGPVLVIEQQHIVVPPVPLPMNRVASSSRKTGRIRMALYFTRQSAEIAMVKADSSPAKAPNSTVQTTA